MAFDPRELLRAGIGKRGAKAAPLGGSRQERVQRLQIGLFGLGSMILLVGLANIIMTTAQQNQASVPEELAATPTEDVPPPPPRDPLADAGVVPDLPAEPEPTVAPAPAPSLPLTGDVPPPAQD